MTENYTDSLEIIDGHIKKFFTKIKISDREGDSLHWR